MNRNQLLKPDELTRAMHVAAANMRDGPSHGAILLMVDADEDCAAVLAARLVENMRSAMPHNAVRVAIPVREIESWIVGGISEFGIDDSDSAGRLEGRIRKHFSHYKKAVDLKPYLKQSDPALLAQRSRSFRDFLNVIRELEGLGGCASE